MSVQCSYSPGCLNPPALDRKSCDLHLQKCRERARQYRLTHLEKERARGRRYRQTEAGRRVHSQSNLRRPKDRTAAYDAVARALVRGRLVKSPCEKCGEFKVEAHHFMGYDEAHRLTVQWLCNLHHRQAHVALRSAA